MYLFSFVHTRSHSDRCTCAPAHTRMHTRALIKRTHVHKGTHVHTHACSCMHKQTRAHTRVQIHSRSLLLVVMIMIMMLGLDNNNNSRRGVDSLHKTGPGEVCRNCQCSLKGNAVKVWWYTAIIVLTAQCNYPNVRYQGFLKKKKNDGNRTDVSSNKLKKEKKKKGKCITL